MKTRGSISRMMLWRFQAARERARRCRWRCRKAKGGSRHASSQSLVHATTFDTRQSTSQIIHDAMVGASGRRTKHTVMPLVLRSGKATGSLQNKLAQQTTHAIHSTVTVCMMYLTCYRRHQKGEDREHGSKHGASQTCTERQQRGWARSKLVPRVNST